MDRIGIVTDSTAYIPRRMREEFEIEVVSLIVNFEGESFPETALGEDFEPFYERLRSSKTLPTTSQPSVGDFLEVYKKLAERFESIISIHITGGISGTVKSAQAAAQMLPDVDITVIDSRATAVGQYLVVDAAARAAHAGCSKEEVLQIVDHVINHLSLYFMPGTLEYLHRGGRIGGAAALLGSLLQIKPILYFNWDKNNIIDLYEKVRTKEKGIQFMLNKLEKAYRRHPDLKTAVVHVGCEDEGNALLSRAKGICPELNPELCAVGPVIGAHIGPGTVGICFYPLTPKLKELIPH